MNDLEKFFFEEKHRRIFKWNHYFDIYDHHFSRFRNKEVVVFEIGVLHGGSLQMWKHYFGPKAKIYAMDINPKMKKLEEYNIKIFIGSQSDRTFLQELINKVPAIDILIDDGGHEMDQQIVSFEELYPHIKQDGVYLCEDVHTSYWPDFGGAYKKPGTFIEYSKNLIDQLNAFHSKNDEHKITPFTTSANSITFYDSVVVIEKKRREMPYAMKEGSKSRV